MKNAMLLICALVLCVFTITRAQTFNDYISATKGDTVVVKDYFDMASNANSLVNVINRDSLDHTSVPAGRVYQLKKAGVYWLTQTINSPWTRTLDIEGPNKNPLVKITGDTLPIITGTMSGSTAFNGGMILVRNKVTLKNLMAVPACSDGSQGWAMIDYGQPNVVLNMDNVLMEHNRWVMVESNNFAGNSLYITNSYFVNMSGQPCRRNGGVYDNVSNPTDTIYVENCTHIMAQGSMYKFRNFPIAQGFFNHNTFVDCVGSIFETLGYQVNFTVTNNLFVNSNAQGYQPGEDVGEADADRLATGIVNVDTLPSSISVTAANRKILVDRNGVYWDSRLNSIATTLNTNHSIGSDDNVFRNWRAQNIKMNDRSQALFDDNTNYPKLTESNWVTTGGDPAFVSPLTLMTTWVDKIVEFADSAGSNANTFALAKWRTAGNPADASHPGNWVYPDFPIPVNLAYTNSAYLTAALSNLPLGDLNWFPTQKASWNAASEHAALLTALNNGTVPNSVATLKGVPTSYEVYQNYPNPFNPSTKINYSLLERGNVTLKVYNILGEEVATLVSGMQEAAKYEVTFNGSNLASGVYFYRLDVNNQSFTKKMILMK